MFTYQLQPRRYALATGGKWVFPGPTTVLLRLAPAQSFGGIEGPSGILAMGSAHETIWDGNTGRSHRISSPPLPKVSVSLQSTNGQYSLSGDELRFTFDCENLEKLDRVVTELHYHVPILLSRVIPDPVVVIYTGGTVSGHAFTWMLQGGVAELLIANADLLEKRFASALSRLALLRSRRSIRLIAALHYAHVAHRLSNVGNSPWEFMAETLLNHAKVPGILFGQTRDSVRMGLRAVPGLDESKIEKVFVPLLLLRDSLDVAHPRLAIVDSTKRPAFYKFVRQLPSEINQLLELIVVAMERGQLELPDVESLTLDATEQQQLDLILAALEPEEVSSGA